MNHYARVIELLAEEQDWKKIVMGIAAKHPSLVVTAIEGGFSDWRAGAYDLYVKQNKKVEAIKYCRALTGFSLKKALVEVNKLK